MWKCSKWGQADLINEALATNLSFEFDAGAGFFGEFAESLVFSDPLEEIFPAFAVVNVLNPDVNPKGDKTKYKCIENPYETMRVPGT